MSTSFVRIRLSFQRSFSFLDVKNCWLLVDTSTCSTIADLEYLIKERFGVLSKNACTIDLYLDDYLLPSQEKIEIIQHNDNIRVELKQFLNEEDESDQGFAALMGSGNEWKVLSTELRTQGSRKKVKRKRENGSLSNARIKSRKKSSENSCLPSTSSDITKGKTRKTSKGIASKTLERQQKPSRSSQNLLSKANPSKRKNNDEISKTTNAKKSKTSSYVKGGEFVAGENDLDCDSSVSESSSSTESLLEFTSKGKSIIGSSKTNAEQRKTVTRGTAKDLVGGKNARESDSSSSETSSESSDESGPSAKSYSKSSAVVNGVKTSVPNVSKHQPNCDKSQSQKGSGNLQKKYLSPIASKSSTVPQGKKKGKCAATVKALSSSSSDSSEDDKPETENAVMKGARKKHLPSSSSSSSSTIENNKETKTQDKHQRNLPLLPSSKSAGEKNVQQRTTRHDNGNPSSSLSTSHIRFDSEDEAAEGQEEDCLMKNITDNFDSTRPYPIITPECTSEQDGEASSKKAVELQKPAQRDYTLFPKLLGPPRTNDKIAYKVLELSASYTPEVSNYKEGTVLSFEPSTGAVMIDLTKESLKKTLGDGNLTGKFELVYEEDGDNQQNTNNEEEDTKVTVLWSSMLDPVLINN